MLQTISQPVQQTNPGHRVPKDSESRKNRPWLKVRLGPRDHDVVRQVDNWKVDKTATSLVTTAIRLITALEAGNWAAALQIYPRLGLVNAQDPQRTPAAPSSSSDPMQDPRDPNSEDLIQPEVAPADPPVPDPVKESLTPPEGNPDPSPLVPLAPPSQAGPLRPELITLYACKRGVTFHLARRGEFHTLCGEVTTHLLSSPREGVEYRRCDKCDQVLNPPPERVVIYAYHNHIPAEFRPTRVNLGRNTPVVQDMVAWATSAGIGLERYAEYVGQYVEKTYSGYVSWARKDPKRPLVMSLEHVSHFLPAWIAEQTRKENLKNGSNATAAAEPAARSGPPKPNLRNLPL